MIVAQNISKTYETKKNQTEALRNINFELDKQEIVAIMGGSGCGKTTFAKILAGMEEASSGTYFFDGIDCSKGVSNTLKQRIAYIFQDHNLLPWRSVEGNLKFPLEIFGKHKDPAYLERLEKALEIVGLAEYRTCLPHELSGGMMQRTGIARALTIDADLMVMDQPFGALDAITRRKLYFDFLRIFCTTGKTCVMVTNSIDEAILFSSRIYMMNGKPGEIEGIISVDIPYSQRTVDILRDQRFTELRLKVMEYVKRQVS